MMQLAWRTSMVVALLLLASVGTASAECAWVLWIKHETLYIRKTERPESSTWWELQKAYPAYAGCDSAKQRVWGVIADQYADLGKFPGVEKIDRVPYEAVFVKLKESEYLRTGSQTQFLYCLPDTIDPRGPKAK